MKQDRIKDPAFVNQLHETSLDLLQWSETFWAKQKTMQNW